LNLSLFILDNLYVFNVYIDSKDKNFDSPESCMIYRDYGMLTITSNMNNNNDNYFFAINQNI